MTHPQSPIPHPPSRACGCGCRKACWGRFGEWRVNHSLLRPSAVSEPCPNRTWIGARSGIGSRKSNLPTCQKCDMEGGGKGLCRIPVPTQNTQRPPSANRPLCGLLCSPFFAFPLSSATEQRNREGVEVGRMMSINKRRSWESRIPPSLRQVRRALTEMVINR